MCELGTIICPFLASVATAGTRQLYSWEVLQKLSSFYYLISKDYTYHVRSCRANMNILFITSVVSHCVFCCSDSFKVFKLCSCLCSSLLPPQFPQEKPVVSVYPPVGHHLVDSNNGTMITSPLITNVSSCSIHYLIRLNISEGCVWWHFDITMSAYI